MAEGQGFEPWIPCGKPPFQDGAIDQLGDPSVLAYFNRYDNLIFLQLFLIV
jgi:hypothetical protein